jgi:hypothetical protein
MGHLPHRSIVASQQSGAALHLGRAAECQDVTSGEARTCIM